MKFCFRKFRARVRVTLFSNVIWVWGATSGVQKKLKNATRAGIKTDRPQIIR